MRLLLIHIRFFYEFLAAGYNGVKQKRIVSAAWFVRIVDYPQPFLMRTAATAAAAATTTRATAEASTIVAVARGSRDADFIHVGHLNESHSSVLDAQVVLKTHVCSLPDLSDPRSCE